jgi:hypothetical protein
MDYTVSTFLISFFGALYVLIRRVHENRVVGVPGGHSQDVYWPLNIAWNFFRSVASRVFLSIKDFITPYLQKFIGSAASGLYRVTASASNKFLYISNMVHGKGSLKKNTGKTSLFIRDIAEYKKDIHRS